MDVTTIRLGSQTRDLLAEYRDRHDYNNYNEAVRNLLQYEDLEDAEASDE